jgi:Flp pilus assembly protein TadG
VSRKRGQALVELALCMPVILLLGFGVVAVTEVADASAGLHAATEAAVAAAARAPDYPSARSLAQQRFLAVIAAYPVKSPALTLDDGKFARGSSITATASGFVDLGWEAMAIVPGRVDLTATISARVDPWRTR